MVLFIGFKRSNTNVSLMRSVYDGPVLKDYFAMSPSRQECAKLRRDISGTQCLGITHIPKATVLEP